MQLNNIPFCVLSKSEFSGWSPAILSNYSSRKYTRLSSHSCDCSKIGDGVGSDRHRPKAHRLQGQGCPRSSAAHHAIPLMPGYGTETHPYLASRAAQHNRVFASMSTHLLHPNPTLLTILYICDRVPESQSPSAPKMDGDSPRGQTTECLVEWGVYNTRSYGALPCPLQRQPDLALLILTRLHRRQHASPCPTLKPVCVTSHPAKSLKTHARPPSSEGREREVILGEGREGSEGRYLAAVKFRSQSMHGISCHARRAPTATPPIMKRGMRGLKVPWSSIPTGTSLLLSGSDISLFRSVSTSLVGVGSSAPQRSGRICVHLQYFRRLDRNLQGDRASGRTYTAGQTGTQNVKNETSPLVTAYKPRTPNP